jgi:GMC oxidoreductase
MRRQRCRIHGDACHDGLLSRSLFVGDRIPLAGVAHQNGTIRFGRDPRTSALDPYCRAHEVDNLYVVDGSFFPSSAAVNPALTIIANALRVGDHLLERMGAPRATTAVERASAGDGPLSGPLGRPGQVKRTERMDSEPRSKPVIGKLTPPRPSAAPSAYSRGR